MNSQRPLKVLMVCLGNICRSPTAEGVLRYQLQQQDLQQQVLVDSAGTSDWHRGEPPDSRSIRHAALRGYDLSSLSSRQVVMQDFEQHDYILAMDSQNLHDLQRLCPTAYQGKLALLLSYGSTSKLQVPDPYERNELAFEEVLDLCELACAAFVTHLISVHGLHAKRGTA